MAATPEAFKAALPKSVFPEVKLTVPVSGAEPAANVTEAVMVSGVPAIPDTGVAETVVAVCACATV
jgi:hypothetical protein